MKKVISVLILQLILLTFVGCSVQNQSVAPIKIDSVRPTPSGLIEIPISVSKSQLEQALESSRGSNNLRIVPLVTSAAQAPASPEYRVFNIKTRSIGELLGLKNADILISAHGYVIQSSLQFYKYLEALRFESKGTSIEVRRGDKPLVLKITFN